MAQKILVALKRGDRIEEIVPYLEEVTKPGMSVVFLIHRPMNRFKWLQAYCGIMECGLEKTLAIRRMVESYSVQMHRQLAQQKVFHTCEALQRLGVKIAVDVYAGSLRKTLRSHVLNGDSQLIVMQPAIGHRVMSFLQGTVSIFSVFKPALFIVCVPASSWDTTFTPTHGRSLIRLILGKRQSATLEGKITAEQTLVLLKRNDRVEEIIPYAEKVTQPGMRVVFLVPYPVNFRPSTLVAPE